MVRDLYGARGLGWRLFVRDISAEYRQSVLGILWAVLPSVATGIVFIVLKNKSVVNFAETTIPYPVYALVGTILWQVFIESLHAPLKTVNGARPILTKVNFPSEALIVSAFCSVVSRLLVKAFVIVGVLVYFGVDFKVGMLLAPAAALALVCLGIAIGLLLTPVGVLFTDVQMGVLLVAQFWFFLTPVVYPPPATFPYSLLASLNPVSPLLIGAREVLTLGSLTTPIAYCGAVAFAGFCLVLAWLIYRVSLPIIIERMSQ